MASSISTNLDALFSKMESFVSTKTVVGEPIHIEGVIIVPLIDLTFGLGVGGADSKESDAAGGGGMGAKITPSAVIVIVNGTAQMINVKNQESVNKLIDLVPGILSKLNLGSFFSKKSPKNDDIVFEKDMEKGE